MSMFENKTSTPSSIRKRLYIRMEICDTVPSPRHCRSRVDMFARECARRVAAMWNVGWEHARTCFSRDYRCCSHCPALDVDHYPTMIKRSLFILALLSWCMSSFLRTQSRTCPESFVAHGARVKKQHHRSHSTLPVLM